MRIRLLLIAYLSWSATYALAQSSADILPGPNDLPPASDVSKGDAAPVCTKSYCEDMRTCAEAYHHYSACGMTDLDRDDDGIPCEDACGKTIPQMQSRIAAQPYASSSTSTALGLMQSEPLKVELSCDGKRTCKQMLTCEEATYYLRQCGVSSLDRDKDGVPCQGLCK